MLEKEMNFKNIDTVGELRNFLKGVSDETELFTCYCGDGAIKDMKISYWCFKECDKVEIEMEIE